MLTEYEESIKEKMSKFYDSLSEKDRRRYAGIEALKLGYGGIRYISSVLNCDEKTISKGIAELNQEEIILEERVRAAGGGRKEKIKAIKNINKIFLEILRDYTAGNPMKEDVKWTNLTKVQIQKEMAKKGIEISKNIVKRLLEKNNFVKRKAQKKNQ